jgi:hypothetical protein|mmetsp:Transcript_11189/g.26667  ORF Transcript_11189/g.26667 Transcript_11189/m.26667 type:complete len:84 (+) Transcript_11189:61-312(+)
MNALARTASVVLPRAQMNVVAQRRAKSTFVKTWLSDPSTYPIIVILAGACVGCTAFTVWKFACHPDVRVSSKTKGQILRTWGW